jgi:hypothetical protein
VRIAHQLGTNRRLEEYVPKVSPVPGVRTPGEVQSVAVSAEGREEVDSLFVDHAGLSRLHRTDGRGRVGTQDGDKQCEASQGANAATATKGDMHAVIYLFHLLSIVNKKDFRM